MSLLGDRERSNRVNSKSNSPNAIPQPNSNSTIPIRYSRVALLLCIANAICYADRTNIGIAIPHFVADQRDRGIVLSSFFYGYILTQIPCSWLASSNQLGVKLVFRLGFTVWTICDLCTIFVSDNLPRLCLTRALMGCGQGVVMPSLHRFATHWFPQSEQSTLVAFVSSGSDLGTILAYMVSPWIISFGGRWQNLYLVFGGLSGIWLVAFVQHVTSKPEEHPNISKEEKELIMSTRRKLNAQPNNTPWKRLLCSKQLWVIYIAHMSYNYSWYVLLGWLPTYLQDNLGLDLQQNKLVAAMPYVFGYCGMLASGKASDWLISKGWKTLHVRRWMNSTASFMPALCLYWLPFCKDSFSAIFLLSASLCFGRASTSGFWIHMMDVGPEYAGEIMGISNTLATLPGIFGNLITGYLLQQTGSWEMVFHIAALVSSSGGIVFLCFSSDEPLVPRSKKGDKEEEEAGILFLESNGDRP